MGVFEDVVSKARSAAETAGRKTGEIVDLAKLKISASEIEGKIGKELLDLGRRVYTAAKEQTDCTDYVALKTEAVDKLYDELNAINDRVAELKNEKKCRACGASNSQEANFCHKCGEKL